jgi:hypothetical protein
MVLASTADQADLYRDGGDAVQDKLADHAEGVLPEAAPLLLVEYDAVPRHRELRTAPEEVRELSPPHIPLTIRRLDVDGVLGAFEEMSLWLVWLFVLGPNGVAAM